MGICEGVETIGLLHRPNRPFRKSAFGDELVALLRLAFDQSYNVVANVLRAYPVIGCFFESTNTKLFSVNLPLKQRKFF